METEKISGSGIVSEIAKTVIEKAPDATEGSTSAINNEETVLETTGEDEKTGKPAHRAGVVTRKPGETRGRKSNAELEAIAKEEAERTMQEEVEKRARELTDFKVTGQQIADGFAYANVVLLGPEFNFMEFKDATGHIIKNEREEFYKVGADMAEQYGWRKLPPWIQISLIMVSYYGIRAAMPPVRERFGGYMKRFFGWTGKKLSGLFKKKEEKQEPQKVGV
jgi:hypothetical protein